MLATAWSYLALLLIGLTSGMLLVINGLNSLMHAIAVGVVPAGIRALPLG